MADSNRGPTRANRSDADDGRGATQVSLGDAFLVEARLQPRDAQTRDAIARLLGYERMLESGPHPAVGPWKPNETRPADTPAPAAGRQEPTAAAAPTTPVSALQLPGARTTADFLGRIDFDRPAWASTPAAFQPASGRDTSLSPPPLFARTQARALLSAMFATLHDGPEIDVARATDTLAEGRRLTSIPYLPVPTLRRGAQVLIDCAEALDPLRDDVQQLLQDLERLFGRGHLEVLYFAHCPSARDSRRRGVSTSPQSRPMAWRSTGGGVPVLIVSDFTLCPPSSDDTDYASLDEWCSFAADVRAAGGLPVGLLPYAPSRWPAALARLVTFVHWSERTTARQLMRALRESRQNTETAR